MSGEKEIDVEVVRGPQVIVDGRRERLVVNQPIEIRQGSKVAAVVVPISSSSVKIELPADRLQVIVAQDSIEVHVSRNLIRIYEDHLFLLYAPSVQNVECSIYGEGCS